MATGDQVDQLFVGLLLEDRSGVVQKPAQIVAMHYLITIFQYLETLPDNLAANALGKRLDWKYALHLPLNHPPLEAMTLCEFRRYSLNRKSGLENLQTVLRRLAVATRPAGKQLIHLQPAEVLGRVCLFTRLARIGDAFNQALQSLAAKQPEWLLAVNLPHWYERYGQRDRNPPLSASLEELSASAQAIGADGAHLLRAVAASGNPGLTGMVELLRLRQTWNEQFEEVEGRTMWRKEACAGCNLSAHI